MQKAVLISFVRNGQSFAKHCGTRIVDIKEVCDFGASLDHYQFTHLNGNGEDLLFAFIFLCTFEKLCIQSSQTRPL